MLWSVAESSALPFSHQFIKSCFICRCKRLCGSRSECTLYLSITCTNTYSHAHMHKKCVAWSLINTIICPLDPLSILSSVLECPPSSASLLLRLIGQSVFGNVSQAHLTQRTQADLDHHISSLFIHALAYISSSPYQFSPRTSGTCALAWRRVARMDRLLW